MHGETVKNHLLFVYSLFGLEMPPLLWNLESLCQYPAAGNINPCSSFFSSFLSLFCLLWKRGSCKMLGTWYTLHRYLARVHLILPFSHWRCINSLLLCPFLSILKSDNAGFIFSVFIINERMLLITKWLLQIRGADFMLCQLWTKYRFVNTYGEWRYISTHS
jgi:hypothetical protein